MSYFISQLIMFAIGFVITTFMAIVGYSFKKMAEKLEQLELRVFGSVTELRVREMIDDKISVIKNQQSELKEDIQEIKQKLDQILYLQILKKYGQTKRD